ncbi:tetratricopeptide repeat protein 25-like [Apis dorsata]|uniref:tetratricopeptide repeat protein 25-like n=1 Tax=Apis dorsata TaxID=7462 RepID=UPI0012934B65|nr:tetratricopeptide repeat protein 25-like [Apis dorsata]
MAVLASRSLKDDLEDLNDTRKAIENAECRARLDHKRTDSKQNLKNSREYAQALHREADQLYRSGDYESALVLYHRAANLYPKDSSHGVAARRTAATISSCNNPSKAVRKVSPISGEQLTAVLCPETAAIIANEKLKKSPEPATIPEVLSYFDNHKSYWKTQPSPRVSSNQLAKSKMAHKQMNNLAETSLKNLQASFDSGKMSSALKIAQELLLVSGGFHDPTRYQIAAYHYLSLIHVALGRHDRAVCSVSRLIRLSKSTADVNLLCRSLVTLGKVHLSFGHLEAAAKAWEHLAKDLKKPIPVAWIRHEIGRCYLETGKYERAMEMGFRCVDAATKGNSKKWMLNGRLLIGQSLAKLGRFVESLEELQVAAKITEEEGDTPMMSYIRDLIDQVAHALRMISFENGSYEIVASAISQDQATAKQNVNLFVSEQTVITTVFSQRKVITGGRREDESGNEGRITVVDEPLTNPDKKSSTYARSDLEEEGGGGNSTFRVKKSSPSDRKNRRISSSPSKSSSLSSSPSYSPKIKEVREKRVMKPRERVQKKIEGNSGNTMGTYVIEEALEKAAEEQVSDNEEGEMVDGVIARTMGGRMPTKLSDFGDKMTQRGDMLDALRVIEELGEKNEVELLEMLREMLFSTDNDKGRQGDFGDSGGDGFRNPRLGQDRQDANNRSIVITLPSSPRKCHANGDFNDCDIPLEFD